MCSEAWRRPEIFAIRECQASVKRAYAFGSLLCYLMTVYDLY